MTSEEHAASASSRWRRKRTLGIATIAIVAALVVGWLARERYAVSSGQQPAERATGDAAPSADPVPVASTSKTEHDFGFLDWSEPCEFVFQIRNDGTAPLKLQRGATSCKCTMGELPEEPVAPGEAAAFRVASKLAPKPGYFSHTATVLTNDPKRPAIEFRLFGVVRAVLAAAPTTIRVVKRPNQPVPRGETLVFSQVWDAMNVTSVTSSLEGVRWGWEPAEADALEDWNAKCGQRLWVEFPETPNEGSLWGVLRVEAEAPGEPSPRVLEIELAGQIASRVAVQGPGYDADLGFLRIGTVRAGRETRHRLIVKVADEHRVLTVRRIEADPEFLRVTLEPYAADNPSLGLYRLDLTLPADAPTSDHMGANHGEVRIETDHPVVPVVHFDVHFAVVP